jgi:predicted ATPase/DNA-binding winged helix-turn-helix (wHTH) protein
MGDSNSSLVESISRQVYAFGSYVCVPQTQELLLHGEVIPLGQRAFQMLLHLVENAGRTITKADVFEAVWPGRVVEDNNLTVQMSAIRRALGGAEQARQYLLTVPGVGYRFIASVETATDVADGKEDEPLRRSRRPGNLPHPLTSFIGREKDISEIDRRLRATRLLTLTGIGGIGKTRVALHYGETVAEQYPDGVWLIDLAHVQGGGLIEDAVAKVFGIGGDDAGYGRQIEHHLRHLNALLIIDNCEHLVVDVARFVSSLLRNTSEIRILATSREILGASGEAVHRIPTLSFAAGGEASGSDPMALDAVRLFVERAEAAIENFTPDEQALATIVRICARLDGIALAIEMAVPWLRVFSLADLADRLQERLRLLGLSDATALPRQRTLRSMIDWSYAALSESESALLRAMSIFARAADLNAIQVVADGGGADAAMDMSRLVEKSLVVVESDGERKCFRLLETIKQYAGEKLAEQARAQYCARHAGHFLAWFEAAEKDWALLPTLDWARRYLGDVEEFRAALSWAFGPAGDPAIGCRLVAVSYPVWWELPELPLREGRSWFEQARRHLDTACLSDAEMARFWLGFSWKDMRMNDAESRPAAERALSIFRTLQDTMGCGAAICRLTGTTMFRRETAAAQLSLLEDAEALLRPHGESRWLALTLIGIGNTHLFGDEPERAHPFYSEAFGIADTLDQWYARTVCTTNMSEVLYMLGRGEEAIEILNAFLSDSLPSRRPPALAPLVSNLFLAGRRREMAHAAHEALHLAGLIGLRASIGWVMETLALHLTDIGDLSRAAQFAGVSRAIHPDPGARVGSRRDVFNRLQVALAADLIPQRLAVLVAEGATWTDERTVQEGQSVCRRID